MEILLNILLVIVLVAFIIYQILEIVGSIRFYKRMEREHEEFINKHSLDLPDVVKILKELVIKLGLESTDINIYQDDLKSAYNELERVIGHE